MIVYRDMKLLHKFLIVFIPFLMFSILSAGFFLTWTSYTFFIRNINQDYDNILATAAGDIHLYVENSQKMVEALAMVLSATSLDSWQQQMALSSFSHSTPELMSVSLLSTDAARVASAGSVIKSEAPVENENTFQKALSGSRAVSGVRRTPESIPYVDIMVPMRRLGKIEGILWGQLNLKSAWDILESVTLGQTGSVSIMDNTGRIIGSRDIETVVNMGDLISAEVLGELKKRPESSYQWFASSGEKRYYNLGYTIPSVEWIIFLNQEDSEIYANLYENIRWASVITVLICLLTIFFGSQQIRLFLKPIQELHRQVKKIGKGNLEERVTGTTKDEIGELGAAFNEMAESLKKYIDKEVQTAIEMAHSRSLAVIGTRYTTITHEIANYLNVVMMAVPALKGESLTKRGMQLITHVEKDTDRMSIFIKEFMAFAKKPDVKLVRTTLEGLIKDVLFVYQEKSQKMGIRLSYEWNPSLPSVNADLRLLYQVVNNLVKNAVEAIESDGGKGSIILKAMVESGFFKLLVADTGPGIPEDTRAQIFDPFFTTKRQRGTGLGLSLCRTIMEAHKGAIECQSAPGKGTTFILSFPLD